MLCGEAMTSFDKIVLTFLAGWALLPIAAMLIRYIRQSNVEILPSSFWVPWGNVLLLSLLALVRNHPVFYHAHLGFVASVFFLWLLVLVWDFREVRNHALKRTASQRGR